MTIERESDHILGLTERLIKIPSTKEYPDNLRAALNLAKTELSGYGYEEFESINDKGIEVPSLLFFNGSERPDRFRVLLHGHLDVVPAQREEQYNPVQHDGKLYGRGAQDMKSGAAALISVFNELGKDLTYPVALSLTVDEEVGGFQGAGHQVAEGVLADFVISGESSGLQIGNEHKGVMILELNANAKGGHTAYGGDDDNAAQILVDFMHRVNELYPGPTGEWETTSSVTKIGTTNKAHNVAPSDASGEIAFRWVPQDEPEMILERIKAIDSRVQIAKGPYGAAHETPRDHPDVQLLAQLINDVTRMEAQYIRKSGSSDLRHWTAVGAGGIDFGPTGSGLHTADEYLQIDSLEQYALILRQFLQGIQQ